LVFTIVSILAIIFLRPLVKKKLETPKFSTNIDALVGKNALVTTDINEFCLGTVKIEGIE
jgi:membrane protein implicated in regulation of membrane protease activity